MGPEVLDGGGEPGAGGTMAPGPKPVYRSNPSLAPIFVDGVGWLLVGDGIVMVSLFAPHGDGEMKVVENRETVRLALTFSGMESLVNYLSTEWPKARERVRPSEQSK